MCLSLGTGLRWKIQPTLEGRPSWFQMHKSHRAVVRGLPWWSERSRLVASRSIVSSNPQKVVDFTASFRVNWRQANHEIHAAGDFGTSW